MANSFLYYIDKNDKYFTGKTAVVTPVHYIILLLQQYYNVYTLQRGLDFCKGNNSGTGSHIVCNVKVWNFASRFVDYKKKTISIRDRR